MIVDRIRPLLTQRGFRFASTLTAKQYNVKRGDYAKVNDDDIAFFQKLLNNDAITNKEDVAPYNEDWPHMYEGQSQVLLKPKTTEEVSKILKHCYDRNLAVVPVGGRTDLVGGAVSVFDEILISLEKMNKVRELDELSGTLVADAGLILENADNYLKEHNHMFPLDLGAKGSCQIGGNISTNAGGVRLLRYGNLHGSVKGIEAVLPNGDIYNGLSHVRKDNSGYDLKQLFIGSEGTLGIVTGISIHCPPKPNATNVALLGLNSFKDVQTLFKKTKSSLGEVLSSFECMDQTGLDLVRGHYPYNDPLPSKPPYVVLIETQGANNDHDTAKLEALLEDVMGSGLVLDGTLAQSQAEQANIWNWRETIPEACNDVAGGTYTYDISMPLATMYDLVADVKERLTQKGLLGDSKDFPVITVTGFGHVGDGNLHIMIPVRYYDEKVHEAIEPFIFEWTQERNGSVSAEHGVGFQKKGFKKYCHDKVQIGLMKHIKDLYDPKHILNPYKYFTEEELKEF